MIKRDREKDSQAIWPARETRREGNELASLRPDQRRWTAERLIRCSAIWERVAKVPNARAILVPTAIAAATRAAIAGAVCPGGWWIQRRRSPRQMICICSAPATPNRKRANFRRYPRSVRDGHLNHALLLYS